MFCTASSFKPPYSIPNLRDMSNSFQEWIDESEESILRELMGNVMYGEFIAGLAAVPAAYDDQNIYNIGDTIADNVNIWRSLQNGNVGNPIIEGAYWTLDSVNEWLEMKLGAFYGMDDIYRWVGMEKMLTPFLYSKWLEENFDTHSGAGIVVGNTENGTVVSPLTRICKAFNDYSRIAGSWWSKENTLYGYLATNDYVFHYTYQGFRNEYGI
jgi:hypothetical protein